MKNLILIFLLSFCTLAAQRTIIFNEIVSSNSVFEDEDNDTPDWIEIFNNTETTISLLNFSLSDNAGNPRKWLFPDVTIGPNEYLVVFASGKDRDDSELHTNFSIKADGEILLLTDNDEQIIDQVEPTAIIPDYSLGRSQYDIDEWLFFPLPTPGEANYSEGYSAISENPIFSVNSGFYTNSVLIELSIPSDSSDIYYTTDGSDPTLSSTKYSSPISITETKVIRAKTFTNDLLSSRIITNTFFINEDFTLPVVSLATNPDNFWDDDIGIYVVGTNGILGECATEVANWNQEWERRVHVEFFENDKNLAFSIDAGVAIHGGCTRHLPQKSLKIIARGEYGSKSIPYKIFPDLPYDEYSSILLRSSGNDNGVTMMRDALMQGLVEDLDLETQAYRPSVVFLNGEYFGIHNIRERHHKNYIIQHHNLVDENIDLLVNTHYATEGDSYHYDALYNFIKNNDLSIQENYNYIKTQMEIDNYIIYMLSEIYFVNRDWYPGNTKFWRPKTSDGRWRWLLYDTDYGFGIFDLETVSRNMIDWVRREDKYPSVIINGLLQNNNFKTKFINTWADLSNSVFKPETVIARIDSYSTIINNEIPAQIQKWGTIASYSKWLTHIDELRYFANTRIPFMNQHLIREFDLGPITTVSIDVNNSDFGEIKLNTLNLNSFPWLGNYFQGIPISLEALPKPGYKFVGWVGDIISSDRVVSYSPTKNNYINAKFEIDDQVYPIVINEINYHSADEIISDPARPDWVEFYNNSDNPIDLIGWEFKDEGNTFTFPNSIILNGREYLVLADTVSNFQHYYPSVSNVFVEGLGFKFDNGGEALALYNLNGTLVDTVRYNDIAPWPTEPDGDGPTLELVHPDLENNIGENWRSSHLEKFGTPGAINDSYRNIYDPVEIPKVAINEINYNSPDMIPARPDWIELYNNSDQTIDLSGWKFKDKDHTFLIPIGTILERRGYLVLTDTLSNFQLYYPSVTNVLSDGFGFGLSSGGEMLSLFNSSEILIDIVDYDVVPPWPTEPDDNGPTLELIHPDFNNEFPENWRASSNAYGTPGTFNSMAQNKIEVNVKVLLEGAYISANNMSGGIFQNGDFPLTQPFNTEPWNYQGTETIIEVPNETITDWLLVELRSEISSETMIAQKAALLKSNGSVVDLDGISNVTFYNIDNGDYYLVLHHRNHLAIMSYDKIHTE